MGTSVNEHDTLRHDPDCLFCRIVDGEIPSERVHEDEQVIAFRDLHPKAPVHVLVVPREHRRDVTQLAAEPALLSHVTTVAAHLAGELADGDFRLVFNTGAGAGQTVFHVHAHVLAGGTLAEGEL
ncbi:histidine triad nucleotide-binding protein [Brachybacterium saurashtrense]|uniref:Histidine triad nucleotide-binding protein n=1 Tax=Brachybacterium saurashtrense TaxID=556288 RepID=A0A345YMR3_9MICO|nr:histidine triad nucleotide-binding protein [Brachybacterium saurashtrense]AXK45215.1 histidine triad nucleotide-binding protein [Brachybacterium saurashtrense]RRR22031.1 histidine triad nucleotide-binding protein [Brachybacterium saurashtrense]